jgi:nucleoside-diphosphate-sugar epimerase
VQRTLNLLITGANGFIGRALAAYLLRPDVQLPQAVQSAGGSRRVTLLDQRYDGPEIAGVERLTGNIADPKVVASAFASPVDVVFHLASIPGGMAEQNYDLGRDVNLTATLHLLEAARAQTLAGKPKPVFVFASSIAVLGGALPAVVDDSTPLRPTLSYGAQKLCGEVLLQDFQQHGWLEARALRLSGIVARPPQRTGQLSAFMSDLIRELAAGRSFHCPVRAEATLWLMSVPCAVRNFVLAAGLSRETCAGRCAWTLPALHCSLSQLVNAVAQVYGADARQRITYGTDAALEANFGRYPPLRTPAAEAVGFSSDADLPTLVEDALASTDGAGL